MIFEERYNIILAACQDLRRRREQLVGPVFAGQVLTGVDVDVPNDQLLSHIVAQALLRRVDRNLLAVKNLYLQHQGVAQIDLFDLLRRAIPPVPQGYRIANQHLAHALCQVQRGMLLDIGIGKGGQMVELLQALRHAPGWLEDLRIVGLDPSAQHLVEARAAIEAIAPQMPFSVQFVAMHALIETCDLSQLGAQLGPSDGLAINAAFALHHTRHAANDQEHRTRLLRQLADLHPRVLTLVEPSANHDTEQLTRRLHSCWRHFGAVFDLVDHSDVTPLEKLAIKETFFGREVRDILGTSDAFRCERHEPHESWLLRLTKAGFVPYPTITLELDLPDYCWASEREGLVRLGYRDVPLVAAFACRTPEAP